MRKKQVIADCRKLLDAYASGNLGFSRMPEESAPEFSDNDNELRLAYFTLPMSLNYQRDSYKLWESALQTFNDKETRAVFDMNNSASLDENALRSHLMRYRLALQPSRHISTWQTISRTISSNWGSMSGLLKAAENDFLKLREIISHKHKKGFPYISGPKIFNYWSFIIQEYGKAKLKNSEYIDIAPDTHITRCSVILGIISEQESVSLTKEQISERWRNLLKGTGINPIDMHPPLWFWSRNNFRFRLC